MDEASLFYEAVPDRGLSRRNLPGAKHSKKRVTVALATNAMGTDMLEPFVIGTANHPRCWGTQTEAHEYGISYAANSTAWMTGILFRDWMVKLHVGLEKTNRKILLLVDNFAGHKINPAEVRLI